METNSKDNTHLDEIRRLGKEYKVEPWALEALFVDWRYGYRCPHCDNHAFDETCSRLEEVISREMINEFSTAKCPQCFTVFTDLQLTEVIDMERDCWAPGDNIPPVPEDGDVEPEYKWRTDTCGCLLEEEEYVAGYNKSELYRTAKQREASEFGRDSLLRQKP